MNKRKTARPVATPHAKPTGRVKFSNLDKVMFPEPGFTKGEVLEFYARIAGHLLPHLKDRPITLERLPDGLNGPDAPHFWQKNTPEYYPKWIPRVKLPTEKGKTIHYVLVNDGETLLYLVNQGAVTFHSYFSTVDHLDCPDYVLFDLDISDSTFANAVKIAKQLHKQFEEMGVESFPKTSGKSGIHILVPWRACGEKGGYDAARSWALEVANVACEALPEIATTERSKSNRGKRVYVDVMQNALGKHVVPPYVLRATAAGTVSMPVAWKDVTGRLNPKRYTIKSVFEYLPKTDPMRGLV